MPGTGTMPRNKSSCSVISHASSTSRSTVDGHSSKVSRGSASSTGGGSSKKKSRGRVPSMRNHMPPPQTLYVAPPPSRNASSPQKVVMTPSRQSVRSGNFPASVPKNHKMAVVDGGGSVGSRSSSSSLPRISPHKNGPASAPRPSRREYGSAKRSIEELNKAIGHEKQIAAITNACAEFDHWDESKHNAELQYGAANALSLLLSMSTDDDEIRMICAALEMVFRASGDVVKTSFQEVGASVVPMLLRLLQRSESGSMKHADVSILNITKVLLYFSRVAELRKHLGRYQGLFGALVRVSTSILNGECRTMRMRVLANLANAEDNKGAMLEHTGLVESILKIAALDLSEGAREYASQALMYLASSSVNQAIMCKNDRLLGTLVKLSVIDDKAETREYAVTALQNLAHLKENRVRLSSYGSGVVLEVLKKTVSSDPNDKARRRAAGALTNLACEETADRMGSHKSLLETLSDVCSKDKNVDVQERAALALTKIASSITVEMSCFDSLLDALVMAALSKHPHGIPAVLRVKARVVENRNRMAHHAGVLETLSEIVLNQRGMYNSKDRDNAVRSLMHLTNENSNRQHICRTGVLNALVKAAALSGSQNADARDSAVIALERLATEHSNRGMMARHDGLLVVIALATEREAKEERMGKTKPGQQHLAKQLLMSLLVAM